jgi:hypothetical protein
MNPCNKCLENNWTFQKLEHPWIRATCTFCSHEVEWETKKKDGREKCKCGNILILREAKITPKKMRKSYYYTAYKYCQKCRKIYYLEKFKVYNK